MIQIPKPCPADWKGMTPQKDGRFCSSCEKIVVDFTKMSDEDIKGYFTTYAEQKTCGRFTDSQLNRPLTEKTPYIKSLHTHIRANVQSSFLKQISLFFLGGMIWLSSCGRRTTGEPALTGDTTVVTCDSSHKPEVTGAVPMPKDSVEKPLIQPHKLQSDTTVKQIEENQIKMGDVCIPPTKK